MNTINPLENVITTQVANYLRLLQRQGKILLYTHIAGESPNRLWRLRNARLGLTSGIPDMLIVYPKKVLFLELKREKLARLSDNQKLWIDTLSQIGKPVYASIAYGFDQAKDIIDSMV